MYSRLVEQALRRVEQALKAALKIAREVYSRLVEQALRRVEQALKAALKIAR